MKSIKKIEFGDFQTPPELAQEIATFLRDSGETADAIVEPTCGRGSFVGAAIAAFPSAKAIYGFDINPQYVRDAADATCQDGGRKTHLECRNFFQVDWAEFFSKLGGIVLVLQPPLGHEFRPRRSRKRQSPREDKLSGS